MNFRNSFIHLHPAAKILIATTLTMIGFVIVQVLSIIMMFKLPADIVGSTTNIADMNMVFMKFMQGFYLILIFLLPAYVFAYISTPDPLGFLKLNSPNKGKDYIWTILLVAGSLTIIGLMAKWNSNLSLPEAFSGVEAYIKDLEV